MKSDKHPIIKYMHYFPVIFMGVSAIILQILCLRQLLSTFSGNELVIGITLAVWLIFVGFGSFLGSRITFRHAFGTTFLAVALVSLPTMLLMRGVRSITGFELGEVVPLSLTILWTALTLSALCIVIGIQFPLAVSYLREKAPEVYSFEAVGAFVSGALFTFLLAGTVDTYTLVMTTAVLNIFVSVFLLKKKVVFLLLVFPVILYTLGSNILHSLQYKGMEFINEKESRYGEIVVLKTKNQFNVYSSEKFQFSYPDAQAEEMKAHLPMSLHPTARRVLIVGGSPAVIRELLKYPVSHIDYVEIDPVLIEISKELLTPEDREILKDRRVNILNIDARRYIKSIPSPGYDLIVLNISEPSTANINRFYTIEFFQEAKTALVGKGVFFMRIPTSSGYIGRKMQMANGSIYTSLKSVFSHVEVSSEEYGIIIASEDAIDINPHVLAENYRGKKITTEYFRSYILVDAFSPLQVSMVRSRLSGIKVVNRDFHPVAYLFNLMLWADIHGGKWLNLFLGLSEYEVTLFIVFVLIIITSFFFVKKKAVHYALFTTGYFTIAFSIIIMLAYQAFFGYIYEMIGLLTGTFMLGGAAGAYVMRRIKKPDNWLRIFDLLAIILLLASTVLLKKEPVFYMIMLVSGMLGGGQYAAGTRSIEGEEKKRIAGNLYAVDLTGSFLGALLTAIFMIPLIGLDKTIYFLVFMKILSLAFLSIYRGSLRIGKD